MSRPKKEFSKLDYCQYLLSSQTNYTLTNYAEHVAKVSHDLVNRFLATERLTASNVWREVKNDIVASENGYVVFDDTVLDKEHSKKIDSVRWQYSGNAHKVIRGIGLLNCVYVNPDTEQFWIIDYRIFDPDKDGKTKVQHVKEMLNNLKNHKKLPFKTVLMDTWYANYQLMLHIHHMEKLFYCPLRKNRLTRPLDSDEKYQHVSLLNWDEESYKTGQLVQLKNMPKEIPLKLFSISVSPNRIDRVVTNDTNQSCSDDTKNICAIRWYVEQFHREIKQLTGIEKCPCRKQRIQRNHITCAIQVWVFLKRKAHQTGQTVYQLKKNLLKDYLTKELVEPQLKFSFA
ncbi:MAG: transposase [Legionellales bacterium]|nr:transposase [Legionellales bacterium]|tara:strand:+ start:4344 stop:5372 length:1029 start_codon:yes stop_codon:yes gene_type:complete